MNDKAIRAEAVAVANGRILAVGSSSDVMKLKGPGTQLVDLAGRTLVPGFVDAHGHIVVGGLQALSANLLAPPYGEVRDIASLQQTLRDWVQKNAAAVEKTKVIISFGYDSAQLKDLRYPTKEELDAVSQDTRQLPALRRCAHRPPYVHTGLPLVRHHARRNRHAAERARRAGRELCRSEPLDRRTSATWRRASPSSTGCRSSSRRFVACVALGGT
jgi:predicted amidohydrolase YtcJ